MTTLSELGHMLIAVEEDGRVIERHSLQDKRFVSGWEEDAGDYNVDLYEYRLKPKVTYYRAYVNEDGEDSLTSQATKFVPFDSFWAEAWSAQRWLKDCEREE